MLVAAIIALYLSPIRFSELPAFIEGFGVWAALIFIIIYALAPLLFIPGSILTLAAGTLFGPIFGTLYVVIGSNLGANVVFGVGRYLGEDVRKKISGTKRIEEWDDKIKKNGFLTVLYSRLIPLFPYNLLNWSLSLTSVKWRDHFFATLLGMLPGIFAYVFLGDALTDIGSQQFWYAILLFVIIAVVPIIIKKSTDKKVKDSRRKNEKI